MPSPRQAVRLRRLVLASSVIVGCLVVVKACGAAPPSSSPVLSNYERSTGDTIRRDCGYSSPLPGRPGWSNPEFERLVDSFLGTIDQTERVRLIGQMARLMTEDLPTIPLMYELSAYAYSSAIRGPTVEADEAVVGWNVQDWDWT